MKKLDVRRAITERGYTVSSFADKADIKLQNLIQNLINGNPSVKKLYFIAEQLGCDITDLFFEQTPSLTEGEGAEENAPAAGDLFSQSAVGTQGEGTTDGAQVGFFVFQGKRFKIVECE